MTELRMCAEKKQFWIGIDSSQNRPYGIKFYHTQHFPQTGQKMSSTNWKVSAMWVWINQEPGRSELKKKKNWVKTQM